MQSKDWWKDGACLEVPEALELFEASGKYITKRKKARQICRACLVRKDCLEEAFKDNIEGWYGGTTFDERQMMASLMLATGRSLDDLYDTPKPLTQQENHKENHPYIGSIPKFVLLPPSSVTHFASNPLTGQVYRTLPVPRLKFGLELP